MPHHKSAAKRLEKSKLERLKNRAVKSRVKTEFKKLATLIEEGKKDEATEMMKDIYSVIDKASKVGVFHRNKAANQKSKASGLFNKAFVEKK